VFEPLRGSLCRVVDSNKSAAMLLDMDRELVSRRELEWKLSSLRREKHRIDDNIKRMETAQQRIFRDAAAAGESEEKKPADATDTGVAKRKRSRSGSASKDRDAKKQDSDEEKPKRQKAEGTAEGKRPDPRSRNLFGKMLGHLHSAKTRLEKEKATKRSEATQAVQDRVEEKLQLSKLNIKEFRKSQFEAQKKEEEIKASALEKEIEDKVQQLLQRDLESYYSTMKNFIRTKAEPPIFYLPAVHTKETEHALEENRASIKHKIASLRVQLPLLTQDDGEARARATAAAAAEACVEKAAEADQNEGEGAAEDKVEEGDKEEVADKDVDDKRSDQDDEKSDDDKDAARSDHKEDDKEDVRDGDEEGEKKADESDDEKRGAASGDEEQADKAEAKPEAEKRQASSDSE